MSNIKKKVSFTLPWPPSENHLHKPCKRTKMVRKYGYAYPKEYLTKKLTDKAIKFYEDCEIELMAQFKKNIPKFYGKTKMLMEFYPPRKTGWDVNNFRKAPEDALVKNGIIPDDQVKYLMPQAPIIHTAQKPAFVKITLEEI